jgi:hypothetical protein
LYRNGFPFHREAFEILLVAHGDTDILDWMATNDLVDRTMLYTARNESILKVLVDRGLPIDIDKSLHHFPPQSEGRLLLQQHLARSESRRRRQRQPQSHDTQQKERNEEKDARLLQQQHHHQLVRNIKTTVSSLDKTLSFIHERLESKERKSDRMDGMIATDPSRRRRRPFTEGRNLFPDVPDSDSVSVSVPAMSLSKDLIVTAKEPQTSPSKLQEEEEEEEEDEGEENATPKMKKARHL